MKVMTFSRFFPAYHPRKGEPTFFIEKMMAGFADKGNGWVMLDEFILYDWYEYYNAIPKWHTIRAGKRWKVGDMFSPRIWSGKPYASKQVTFSEPIEIKKIWDIEFDACGVHSIGGFYDYNSGDELGSCQKLARNDGLSEEDFLLWFPTGKEFSGQIICWNEKIEY